MCPPQQTVVQFGVSRLCLFIAPPQMVLILSRMFFIPPVRPSISTRLAPAPFRRASD